MYAVAWSVENQQVGDLLLGRVVAADSFPLLHWNVLILRSKLF